MTTCGTEGNLHAILLARECHPDGILYSSRETHYSIFKAARYYRMDAKSIPTLPMGEIDYDALERELAKNKDKVRGGGLSGGDMTGAERRQRGAMTTRSEATKRLPTHPRFAR